MSAATQLTRFTTKCPFAVMTRAVASAVLDRKEIEELFEEEAEQQYTGEIPFTAVAMSMAELTLGTIASKNRAYDEYKERIEASKTAFYNKLNRTEPKVSRALVRHSAAKTQALLGELKFQPWEVLAGFRCYSIDGNHFGQSERRLKESRTLSAPPLPGTVVAKYDHQTGLFCDAYPMECGHDQENAIIDQVIADAEPEEVYVADRIYCTKQFVFGLIGAGAYVLVRQKLSFTGDLQGKRKRIGESESGVVFEQAVKITRGKDTQIIRRITIELFEPTRDGDWEVHLFTNLPSTVSAIEISNAYRRRWEIETGFYYLTTTLCCESKGNCYPRCAIFQFCMAMVAYNARRLLFAALYAVHDEPVVDRVSEFKVGVEVTRYIDGLALAIDEQEWQSEVSATEGGLAKFLLQVAKTIDLKKYKKSVRGPKTPPPDKKKMSRTSHVSAQKLLRQRKENAR